MEEKTRSKKWMVEGTVWKVGDNVNTESWSDSWDEKYAARIREALA